MTDAVCTLPFVPRPLPEEILGSWLARCQALALPGGWKQFAKTYVGTAEVCIPLFNFDNDRQAILSIIAQLGMTLEEAKTRLTLAPYWGRFLPAGQTSSKLLKQQNLCTGRSGPKNPRFCPACIESDTALLGCAYWHRSHQLPNVFGCEQHHLQLLERCSACGRLPRRRSVTFVHPLSTACECGSDLRRQGTRIDASALYWRLVRFSTEALIADPVPLPAGSIPTYFHRLASAPKPIQFNATVNDARRRFTPLGFDLDLSLSCRRSTRELCVFFASQGLSLAASLDQLSKAAPNADGNPKDQSWRKNPSVARCRKALRAWASSHPHLGPASAGELYWRVRLLDDKWLNNHFSFRSGRRVVPSIVDDREVVTRYLRVGDRRNAAWTSAGQRAGVRDLDWLQSALASSLFQMRVQRIAEHAAKQQHLLVQAVRFVQSAEPPVMVSYPLLSQCTGLPIHSIGRVVRANSELSTLIREVNSTKTYRLLRWIAEDILSSGKPLLSTVWAARARIPTDTRTTQLMYSIASELSSLGFELGARWTLRAAR